MDRRSIYLRKLILDAYTSARRGHLSPAFSLVEILRVLYDHILKYDPKNPKWPLRDRCILSKGHGCLALYAILADRGFFPKEELKRFCTLQGMLGGHPEIKIPGVEASTGSLGHGLSIGVGIAISAKLKKESWRVFVIVGDGECNEGSIWEAALIASKHLLSNLTVIVDYNKFQSYGPVSQVSKLEPLKDKWKSFGFEVRDVDGHDIEALKKHLRDVPFVPDKPSALICHTVKGKGIEFVENDPTWHHKSSLSGEVIEKLYQSLEKYDA